MASDRLGYDPRPHVETAGDYFLAMTVSHADLPFAMAFAVLLSQAFPGLWFILGRLYVKDGQFFRRERGFKLNLVRATNVHLSREMRRAMGGGKRDASSKKPE